MTVSFSIPISASVSPSFIHHDTCNITITKLFTSSFPFFYTIMQLKLQDYWQILLRCTQTWPWHSFSCCWWNSWLNTLFLVVFLAPTIRLHVLWLYFESFWFWNAAYCILYKIKHCTSWYRHNLSWKLYHFQNIVLENLIHIF